MFSLITCFYRILLTILMKSGPENVMNGFSIFVSAKTYECTNNQRRN